MALASSLGIESACIVNGTSSGIEPIGEFERPDGFRRTRAAGVVRCWGRRMEADECDGLGGRRTRRVQRMRTVRKNQCNVHLRSQIDKIPRPLACRVPDKAATGID